MFMQIRMCNYHARRLDLQQEITPKNKRHVSRVQAQEIYNTGETGRIFKYRQNLVKVSTSDAKKNYTDFTFLASDALAFAVGYGRQMRVDYCSAVRPLADIN